MYLLSAANGVINDDSQILAQNRDLCLLHLQSTPPLKESQSEYCHDVRYK